MDGGRGREVYERMQIDQINIWTWSYLFILYLILDVLNIRYILGAQQLKPFSAANSSFAICLLVAIGTINYIENILNLIPIALGCYCGTLGAVYYEKKKNESRNNVPRTEGDEK